MNKVRSLAEMFWISGFILFTLLSGNVIFAAGPDSVVFKTNAPAHPFVHCPLEGLMNEENAIRAGLLYDVERKVIVWEKDMNYAYPVASLTKMMVALLAIEDIKAGRANWTDEITVSREYYKGSRRHKRKYTVEEIYTLDELVRWAMVSSNNAATVWIGKKLGGGSLEPFIRRMNDKCLELGMEHTFFSNPSGLPAVSGEMDNSSSPNDLLILALELIKYQEILDITCQGNICVGPGNKTAIYRNHNGLVIQYPGEVDGLKTGYTKNARFCLVATSNKSGYRLVSIVLGARSPYYRNQLVAGMMNNYYQLLGIGSLGESSGDPMLARSVADSLDRNINVSRVSPGVDPGMDDQQAYRTVYVKSKKTHVVRKGETLYGIADRYNCYASEIKKWNRLKSSYLKSGQKLVIMQTVGKKVAIDKTGTDSMVVAEEQVKLKPETTKTRISSAEKNAKGSIQGPGKEWKDKFVYHTVQPGDTLWNIAQRYSGTTVEKIKKANKIYNSKNLKPGTKLKIQVSS